MGLGRLDEAVGELLAAYEGLSLALGPDHERSRAAARTLSELYERTGDVGESVCFERLVRAVSSRSQ